MPKFKFVDLAQGQATAGTVPNASATSITLDDSADTALFTAKGSPSATNPIPAVLSETNNPQTATKREDVLITAISTDTFTIARNAESEGAKDFTGGDCFITQVWNQHIADNMLQRDGDTASRLAGVPVDRTADISGNALAFDYTKGDYQYVTLSAAGTTLTVTNMPAGSTMKIVIFGADTYAPTITSFTPVLNVDTITFDAITVVIAEALTNTTVRYIAGGTYAS